MELEGLNVLLAEDDPAEQVGLARVLEALGATVEVAGDPGTLRNALDRGRADVVMIGTRPGGAFSGQLGWFAGLARRPATVALLAPRSSDEGTAADAVIDWPVPAGVDPGVAVAAAVGAARARRGAARSAEIDFEIYSGLAAAVGPSALGELLANVDADISDAYDRMRRAISGSDMVGLRSATHILIAVAGAIGAVGLQALSERLNRAAHEGDNSRVATLAAEASAEADRVLAFVRSRRG